MFLRKPIGSRDSGFSLTEVLIAVLITGMVMASVFLLLQRGQISFRREPEISAMNTNARASLDRISQDLTVSGFNTPINMPVMWLDGGGLTPDEITILYGDPEFPISQPKPCGAGGGGGVPCNTIGASAVLNLDPYSFSPQPPDYAQAYSDGMVLFAIQGPNGNPACDGVQPGIIRLQLAQAPQCAGTGGSASGPAACETVSLNYNPSAVTELNPPGGFSNDVLVHCAVIGLFHVVQYRVNPLPPAANPTLERRDVALGEAWNPIADNIENLQVQYAQGMGLLFEDVPSLAPVGNDPNSWITGVRVTVSGRNESRNLQGASAGVFAADDTFLRQSFTTTVSLRNQLSQAQQRAEGLGLLSWN